jgi:hypothetical protein
MKLKLEPEHVLAEIWRERPSEITYIKRRQDVK